MLNNKNRFFFYGDLVALTANADLGWQFNAWTGDLNASTNPIVVTMDGGKTITAHFIQSEIKEYFVPLYMNEP